MSSFMSHDQYIASQISPVYAFHVFIDVYSYLLIFNYLFVLLGGEGRPWGYISRVFGDVAKSERSTLLSCRVVRLCRSDV